MATAGELRILGFLAALGLLGVGVRSMDLKRLERSAIGERAGWGWGVGRLAEGNEPRGAARALAAQRAAVDSARRSGQLSRQSSRGAIRRSSGSTAGRTTTNASPKTALRSSNGRPSRRSTEASFPIDLNRATAEELEALPRIGPAIAKRIIEYRETTGSFQVLEDLRHVRGIGPATLRLLDTLVTFSSRHSP